MRGSRVRGLADWVIVTAIDEHLQPKGWRLSAYLSAANRTEVTAIPALGFQMLCDFLPKSQERLAVTRTLGAPWDMMNKLSIFRPDAIEETGFNEGRHIAKPMGSVKLPPRDELMLLHYKYLGFERTLARHRQQSTGLGRTDIANNWGVQYFWDCTRLRAEWDTFASQAIDISESNFVPWSTPTRVRYWRPEGFSDAPPRWVHRLGLRFGQTAL